MTDPVEIPTSHSINHSLSASSHPSATHASIHCSFTASSSAITTSLLSSNQKPRSANLQDIKPIKQLITQKHKYADLAENAKTATKVCFIAAALTTVGGIAGPVYLLLATPFLLLSGLISSIVWGVRCYLEKKYDAKIIEYAHQQGIDPNSLMQLIARKKAAPPTQVPLEDLYNQLSILENQQIVGNELLLHDIRALLENERSESNPQLKLIYKDIAAYLIEITILTHSPDFQKLVEHGNAYFANMDEDFTSLLAQIPEEEQVRCKLLYEHYKTALSNFQGNQKDTLYFIDANILFQKMIILRQEMTDKKDQFRFKQVQFRLDPIQTSHDLQFLATQPR